MRFRALLLSLCSAFFSLLANAGSNASLTLDERRWLDENQARIVLAVETGYPPFVFLDTDRRPAGLAHDYLRLVETKIGASFRQKQLPGLKDIFEKVRSGEVHIVNAVTKTAEREKFLSFTAPFIAVPNVILVRSDRPGDLREENLAGLTVSLVSNYAITEYLTGKPLGLQPDLVPDDQTALLNVSFGRSDAAVVDLATASYLISQKGITNLRIAGEATLSIRLAFATPLDQPVLHAILQKGLDAISAEEREVIKQRWIRVAGPNLLADWRFWLAVGGLLLFVFAVIAIIALWNRTLRRQVRERTAELERERVLLEQRVQERTAELQRSEERLRLALSAGRLGWFDADVQTGMVQVGDEYPRLLGFAPEEFVSSIQNWMRNIHPDDVPQVRATFEKLLQTGGPNSMEYRRQNKAGEWQWLQSTGEVVEWDADGKALRLAGIHQDITARKLTELELREERLVRDTIQDAIPGISYAMDANGYFTFWNNNFERVTGRNAEELRQLNAADLFEGEGRAHIVERITQTFVTGEGDAEADLIAKDGQHTRYYFTGRRIEIGGQPILVGAGVDISSRMAAELALQRHRQHLEELVQERTVELIEAKELAEAANRAKSTFLANMSHELRTPMNAIMGMTDMVLRHASDPKQIDQLTKAKTASTHLLHVINDILDISKIEAGRLQLEQTDFRLGEILENIASLMGHRAAEKGLKLQIDLEAGLPMRRFSGDPMRLGQILLNLAGNALKFTDSGAITLRARLAEETPDGVLLRWEVADTGIGIEPAAQARLFTAFEQADGSMTRKYGGTGLGLAISKRLVQMMGGDIGVDSVVGQGSTFWFTVRLGKAGSDAIASSGHLQPGGLPVPPEPTFTQDSAEIRLQTQFAGTRILLAEDEPVNQEVSRSLLEDVGLVVDLAADGQEAVALARQNRYALILMDMQMPHLNGVDATKMMRANSLNRATPILAMTANAFGEDRQICLDAGMNDHIAKPVAPTVLYEALLMWIGKAVADIPSARL